MACVTAILLILFSAAFRPIKSDPLENDQQNSKLQSELEQQRLNNEQMRAHLTRLLEQLTDMAAHFEANNPVDVRVVLQELRKLIEENEDRYNESKSEMDNPVNPVDVQVELQELRKLIEENENRAQNRYDESKSEMETQHRENKGEARTRYLDFQREFGEVKESVAQHCQSASTIQTPTPTPTQLPPSLAACSDSFDVSKKSEPATANGSKQEGGKTVKKCMQLCVKNLKCEGFVYRKKEKKNNRCLHYSIHISASELTKANNVDFYSRIRCPVKDLDIMKMSPPAECDLCWKITNYQEKKAAGSYLLSAEFTASHCGQPYRLQAAVCLNGEGEGDGSHLTVWLSLVSGEHDGSLPWPFKQSVTIRIVDMNHEVNHVTYQHWFDQHQQYDQDPIKNPSGGLLLYIPTFASHEDVEKCVNNDTLVLTVLVG